MCGRLVNLDTVARVLAEYYHLKTDTQLAALNDALSRVPAETVGKELFGISEQLNDLISRQAAIDALMEILDRPNHAEFLYTDEICKALKALPPAQPERIKGHWIDAVIPNDSGGIPVIVCDKCNTFFPLQFGDGHNFCPNCGADMRGENDG